ncbi:TMEM175 family protein [Subtercola endophyticus]|uniref:TMEM175 family protein n=1 Tax=Subtercola endophyticus TaxID=2895559 RepID=UPI001E5598C3|nr:TMEM175 family protein [Subtercola endophyticus]UFS60876.1 DUF1211 domain-containing protein [Subtercola endophyticus]
MAGRAGTGAGADAGAGADERYKGILREHTNSERLQFFSDAVFAIALTLLVLEIAVPEIEHPTNLELNDSLLQLIPKFYAYVLSFGVIAINWAGHHRKFAVTKDYDGGTIWIDLLLLFLVAFLPFPTALFSDYPGYETPVILYSLVVASISLVQYWLWAYAYRRGFLDERIDLSIYRMVRARLLVVPIVFLLSIPIALLPFDEAPYFAMYFWIIIWPANIVTERVTGGRAAARFL